MRSLTSTKCSNLGISPVKIIEILRNSEKIRRTFDEKLQNLPSPLKINKNCVESCKNYANVLQKHRNLEWCKGKKCRSRQELSNEYLLAKSGFDTAENEPPKGSKNVCSKRPRWWAATRIHIIWSPGTSRLGQGVRKRTAVRPGVNWVVRQPCSELQN